MHAILVQHVLAEKKQVNLVLRNKIKIVPIIYFVTIKKINYCCWTILNSIFLWCYLIFLEFWMMPKQLQRQQQHQQQQQQQQQHQQQQQQTAIIYFSE